MPAAGCQTIAPVALTLSVGAVHASGGLMDGPLMQGGMG
jgi:hypothetical protein